MRPSEDRGETLLEVLVSMIVMAIVVAALFAGIATAARSAKTQREFTAMDTALRSYAELIKNSVRTQCTAPGGALTLPAFTPPAGVSMSIDPPTPVCPAATLDPVTGLVGTVRLTATSDGGTRQLVLGVRTP